MREGTSWHPFRCSLPPAGYTGGHHDQKTSLSGSHFGRRLLTIPPPSRLGIRIVDQDAAATARGEAFIATADNPSAIYYNPAGITQLEGTQVRVGAYAISLESSVKPDAPGSKQLDSKFGYQAAPQFYLTYKMRISLSPSASGFTRLLDSGSNIADDTPFRTLAKKGAIQYVSVNPVFGAPTYQDPVAGGGRELNYGKAKLARGIVTPGDEFLFEGYGVGYGFNAGVSLEAASHAFLRPDYRSASTLDFSGHSRVRIPVFTVATPFGPFTVPRFTSENDANLEFDFPQTVVLGYSFRPTPDWNFEVNVDWTDWDSLNTLTVEQTSGAVALPFNWESSFLYSFGVTRELPRKLSVSAGYIYSENSIPNESFNPLIPDSNRHILSVGLGQNGERLSWDVTYQYAYGPHREIDNGTRGKWRLPFKADALTFAVGYRF